MARYTGSAFKKARRVGISLLENGKELAKKPYRPGQHGLNRRYKASEYAKQLTEKQKVRFMYGLNEKQFKKVFEKAGKMPGIHGENLLILLESRLDNVVYRLGLAPTRRASRQMVNHGHVLLNNHKADIPSIMVNPGDTITLKEKSINHPVIKATRESINTTVDYVNWDDKKNIGTYVRFPLRSELNPEITEALIVEFYNR